VTFVITAENRSDVLGRVVRLFEDLRVEIEALYMIRRQGSETLRIHVTVETNEADRRHIESRLQKVLNVRTVRAERSSEEVLGEAPNEGSTSR
jgi:acetolactate synthase small subunit